MLKDIVARAYCWEAEAKITFWQFSTHSDDQCESRGIAESRLQKVNSISFDSHVHFRAQCSEPGYETDDDNRHRELKNDTAL